MYDFPFPLAHAQVQLIPFRASACHLNLPLPLYHVCKLIHAKLPPLDRQMPALDFSGATLSRRAQVCSAGPGSAAGFVEIEVARAHDDVVSKTVDGASGCCDAATGALDTGRGGGCGGRGGKWHEMEE